jgi:hypothetical protein
MDRDTYDNETPLMDEVEKHIRKLIKPLKDEDELKRVLKVKLTKKEFKVLNAWANDDDMKTLLEKLSLDEERYGELSLKLIKKLNQEKLKQEMMI